VPASVPVVSASSRFAAGVIVGSGTAASSARRKRDELNGVMPPDGIRSPIEDVRLTRFAKPDIAHGVPP